MPMDIPARPFELRLQPQDSLFNLTCVGIFFLSAVGWLVLTARLMAGKLMVFFPFGAMFTMVAAIRWLHAPCILSTDSNGFSLAVKRGSFDIPVSVRTWTWDELSSFEFFTYRGTVLTLEVKDDSFVFKWGDLYQLHTVLHKYFPEKEKHS